MNRTKIEWTDYTWNPITGCLNGCYYCYGRKIAQRFGKTEEERQFKPIFHPERLNEPKLIKKPSKIFTCSMSDFFASWNKGQYQITQTIKECPQHTFQILTKQYRNLYPMPKNTWIGVTINFGLLAQEAIDYLKGPRTDGNLKFISFEPLLDKISCNLEGIDWIIIGAQTNPLKRPPKEWVDFLTKQAVDLDIPIFQKNNLGVENPIQEFPKEAEE